MWSLFFSGSSLHAMYMNVNKTVKKYFHGSEQNHKKILPRKGRINSNFFNSRVILPTARKAKQEVLVDFMSIKDMLA